MYWQGNKLGYLPAFENIVLANMLDAGVELHAFVSRMDLQVALTSALAVEVYAHLLVPGKLLLETGQSGRRANDVEDIYRTGFLE